MPDHGLISSYESHEKRRTGKICGAFSRMHKSLDDLMLARAPTSPAQCLYIMGLGTSIYIISVRCVTLRNMDLMIKLLGV